MKMNRQVFDPSETGLMKTLNDWEEHALRHVWESGEDGATSGDVWRAVNEILSEHGGSISRASIIFLLDDMVELDVLGYKTESGKGGMHRRYTPRLNENGYIKHVIKTNLESMIRDFPTETSEALRNYT